MSAQTVGYKAKAFEPRNLAFYFLLAFGLTWISAALLWLLGLEMTSSLAFPGVLLLALIGLPGVFGPSLAAFIITAATEGKPGVKALWGRFWNRNPGLTWLLVALLGYDIMRLLANLIASAVDGQAYPFIDQSGPLWMIIPLFLQSFLFSGMGEEFGWRGYALPRFQVRWNALISSLILGLIWISWHIPFFFIPGQALYQRNFLQWVPLVLLSSVIHTWLFNNTRGSVLTAALFHAALNTSLIVLPTLTSLWYYYGIFLLAVVLIVIVFGAKSLTRKYHDRTGSQ